MTKRTGFLRSVGNLADLHMTNLQVVTGQDAANFVFIDFFNFHTITTCEFIVLYSINKKTKYVKQAGGELKEIILKFL